MTTTTIRAKRWTPLGIFATIIGFVLWWPVGLAILGYILWGGSIDGLIDDAIARLRETLKSGCKPAVASGNAAFDSYKAETLKRLDEEQKEFAAYVQKLRDARDAEEFQRFMSERRGS